MFPSLFFFPPRGRRRRRRRRPLFPLYRARLVPRVRDRDLSVENIQPRTFITVVETSVKFCPVARLFIFPVFSHATRVPFTACPRFPDIPAAAVYLELNR